MHFSTYVANSPLIQMISHIGQPVADNFLLSPVYWEEEFRSNQKQTGQLL
jgi:hypothetical protein